MQKNKISFYPMVTDVENEPYYEYKVCEKLLVYASSNYSTSLWDELSSLQLRLLIECIKPFVVQMNFISILSSYSK